MRLILVVIIAIILFTPHLQAKQKISPKKFNLAKERIESGKITILYKLKRHGFKSIADVYELYINLNTVNWKEQQYKFASIELQRLINGYSKKTKNLDWSILEKQLERWQLAAAPKQPDWPEHIIHEKEGDKQLVDKQHQLALKSYFTSLKLTLKTKPKSSRLLVKIANLCNTPDTKAYNSTMALDYYQKAIQRREKYRRKASSDERYYPNYQKVTLSYLYMEAGKILEDTKKYTKALKYYREAYREKDFEAAFKIGDFYSSGKFLNKKDNKNALKYYQRGIELIGKYKSKSPEYKLHNQKLAEYTFKYGIHDKNAIRHFEQCCAMGISECAFYLGAVYANGLIVKKNLNQALAWFTLSHAMGYIDATDSIIDTQNKMNDQKKRYAKLFARNFVSDWKQKYPKQIIRNQ